MPEFKRKNGSGPFDRFVKILKERMDERKRLEDAKIAHSGKGESVRVTPQQSRSFADVYGAPKCLFWNCTRTIRKDHILCSDHYQDLQYDLIDECKGCGLLKEKRYSWCLTCANKPSPSPRSGKPATQQKIASRNSHGFVKSPHGMRQQNRK